MFCLNQCVRFGIVHTTHYTYSQCVRFGIVHTSHDTYSSVYGLELYIHHTIHIVNVYGLELYIHHTIHIVSVSSNNHLWKPITSGELTRQWSKSNRPELFISQWFESKEA